MLARRYLRELGAEAVDEHAAQVHGLVGIRLQLLVHAHLLTGDTCGREVTEAQVSKLKAAAPTHRPDALRWRLWARMKNWEIVPRQRETN